MAATESAAGGERRTRQRERQAAGYAPGTGLSVVRDELERQPRDPFEVDRGHAAEALQVAWGDTYAITAIADGFRAVRRNGKRVTLMAGTPDEMVREMREDMAGGAQ